MSKNKMLSFLKEKLHHNLALKVVSVLGAVLLWTYITNTQDPYDAVTFYDVPVQVINDEKLTSNDKIVEILSGSEVTVTVEGRRSICNVLTVDDVIAVADFEKTTENATVPIDVSIKGYTDKQLSITRGRGEFMKLSLEDYASKEFKVTIETSGKPADGYVIDNAVASPNVITVSGSKMQLSRIQSVVVTVNVDSLSGTSTINLKPVVYDMNDDVIAGDKLTLSTPSVQVTTAIYPVSNIKVYAYMTGDVDANYEANSISSYPSSVSIAGKPEEVAKMLEESPSLRAYVDVTNAKQDVEKTIDMSTLIDSSKYPSVHIVSSDSMLAVKVSVTELQQKELMISAENLSLINGKENFSYEVRMLSTRKVVVKATRGWLDGLTVDSLKPLLDLGKIESPGLITVPVQFGDFQGIDVLTEVTATVLVSPLDTNELQ